MNTFNVADYGILKYNVMVASFIAWGNKENLKAENITWEALETICGMFTTKVNFKLMCQIYLYGFWEEALPSQFLCEAQSLRWSPFLPPSSWSSASFYSPLSQKSVSQEEIKALLSYAVYYNIHHNEIV